MKSSALFSIALISVMAASSASFAQGRASAQGATSNAGIQSRIHTPGTGLTTGTTPLQTRIQAPVTGSGVAAPGTGQAISSNGGRGIHTPGTGLTTTAPTPVSAPTSN